MRNFEVVHCEIEGDSCRMLLRGAQNTVVKIAKTECRGPGMPSTDLNNVIDVSSACSGNEAFPYELLVHYALDSAEMAGYTVSVQIFEEMDCLEVLESVLFAFNRMASTLFSVESGDNILIVKNDNSIVCQTFVDVVI